MKGERRCRQVITMRMRKKAWARPELEQCPYFISQPQEQKGRWHDWFAEKRPIHLELGCGKGVFLSQLAPQHPKVNYIGIDLSPDVLGVARRNIEARYQEHGLTVNNIALIAYQIENILKIMDEQDRVDRIYINFCNPWSKGKHHKRRLTHIRQLELYKTFLADGGEVHFKTDDSDLYLSTLNYFRESGFRILRTTRDLYADRWPENVTTEHELMFTAQGIPIKAIVAKWEKQM